MLRKAPQFGEHSPGTSAPDFAVDISFFAPKKKITVPFANTTEAVVSGLHRKKSGSHHSNKLENPSVELI